MRKILTKNFFQRDTLQVARDLLGKFLVLERGGKKMEAMITEVEAYDGPDDKASHASRGKTARNEIMFAAGGNWYVYFVYGFHHMLNITTGGKDYPAAILIRAVEGVTGPGRVTKYFGVDKRFNKQPASKKTGLYIVDKGIKMSPRQIKTAPRTGVDYAGEKWAKKPYKLRITN